MNHNPTQRRIPAATLSRHPMPRCTRVHRPRRPRRETALCRPVSTPPVAESEKQIAGETPRRYLAWRSYLDRLVAGVLLVLSAPLLVVIYLSVRLTSRGPAFYTQRRVGLYGRVFSIYKFRSMCVEAEQGTGAVWSQPGDPRVTPVGRFLRATHLDELPQLLNILFGQMALIGPRPERPEIVAVLQEQIPAYRERLNMLPGVTGLAQVTLPADSDLDSVRRKTVLDRQYIRTASAKMDLHVLFCTVMLVFQLQRRIDARQWEALV